MKLLTITTLAVGLFATACGDDIEEVTEVVNKPVPGEPGKDGEDGKDGKDGTSCTVDDVAGGALISCTDGTEQVVLDGVDGADGSDGADAELPDTAVAEIIDPCGDGPDFDEVLLVLADGSIVTYFEGAQGFLSVLECNTKYKTTDSQACKFFLNSACEYVED